MRGFRLTAKAGSRAGAVYLGLGQGGLIDGGGLASVRSAPDGDLSDRFQLSLEGRSKGLFAATTWGESLAEVRSPVLSLCCAP